LTSPAVVAEADKPPYRATRPPEIGEKASTNDERRDPKAAAFIVLTPRGLLNGVDPTELSKRARRLELPTFSLEG
jgi:hypothetical protein